MLGFVLLVEIRGVVGASARCNSEMSVLAQANERQPGPAGSSGQNAHYTVGAPRRTSLFDAGSCSCALRANCACKSVCHAKHFGHR